MINKLSLLFGLVLCFHSTPAQEFYDYSKAEEELKPYTVHSNMVYAVGAVNDGMDSMELTLDAYVPDGLDAYTKAAILVIHGGGFRNGSKNTARYVATAKYFAERGFVAFSMNYRKEGDKAPAPTKRIAAYVDGKAALRWIHANRDNYGIDSNNVFTFGGSAGAIIALFISLTDRDVYLTDKEGGEIPEENNPDASMRVQGVINFAGGMWGGEHELDRTDPAVMILHGTEDDRVFYVHALNLKSRSEEINHDCVLVPFEGAGHMPWNATYGGKSIWELAFEFSINRLRLPDLLPPQKR